MKLRLLDNSVRLRLSIAEAASLASGNTLSAALRFPMGETFRYELSPSTSDSASAKFDGEILGISAPSDDIMHWSATDAVTLSYTLNGETECMTVKIEKDFKCLAPRDGEDESALFPHPQDKSVSCGE